MTSKHVGPNHQTIVTAVKSPEIIENILNSIIYDSLSLGKACIKEGTTRGTFLLWVRDDRELANQYIEACKIRHEAMADEIMDISDDVTEDEIYTLDGNRKANNEWINRSRLRIETRKWLLSKMLPKKYGEKIEVEGSGNVTINLTKLSKKNNG